MNKGSQPEEWMFCNFAGSISTSKQHDLNLTQFTAFLSEEAEELIDLVATDCWILLCTGYPCEDLLLMSNRAKLVDWKLRPPHGRVLNSGWEEEEPSIHIRMETSTKIYCICALFSDKWWTLVAWPWRLCSERTIPLYRAQDNTMSMPRGSLL